MRILSINSSKGQTVIWKGKSIRTGIFKTPVLGPTNILKLHLEGDRQSDLRVHGGPDKAVYSYDLHDSVWWSRELGRELTPGAFGENLTTEGLLDREVNVGDIISAGGAILQAVQPRLPCYKLGVKFDDEQMPRRFMQAARWGIYFRVLQEGSIEAGDSIEYVSRDPHGVRIADLARISAGGAIHVELIRKALEIPSLQENWRNKLTELANKLGIIR